FRSPVLGPPGQVGAFDGLAGAGAFNGGGIDDPGVVGPDAGVGDQVSDEGADQSGCFAQALVVSALLGQVGEAFGQVSADVAQPSGFVGVAKYGLHEGECDQVGVGQVGVEV